MLWNSIFEFYIKYVFGGYTADGSTYDATLGYCFQTGDQEYLENYTYNLMVNIFKNDQGDFISIPFGNYLSFIATIITIVALVIVCILIIKKIFSICFNLFTGRSIF